LGKVSWTENQPIFVDYRADFILNIAATTTAADQYITDQNSYWVESHAQGFGASAVSWSFDATGIIDGPVGGSYSWTPDEAAGVTPPTEWRPVTEPQKDDVGGDLANDRMKKGSWNS
jgi:hypothetical protein